MRYLITKNSVSLNYDGITKTIDKTDHRYTHIVEALKNKSFDLIPKIIDGLKNVIGLSSGNNGFKIENGQVYIDGTTVNGHIAAKIVEYIDQGLDPISLVNFWRNLQKNPSVTARERLFDFLQNGNHPFTDDGHFIAYKKVRNDMKDIHSGTFDNSVGCTPTMDRSQVNDDHRTPCAPGLHVASWDYAKNNMGSGILIDCKVNPKDIVAVPYDYQNMKMRTCRYEVIAIAKDKREDFHIEEPKVEIKLETPVQIVANVPIVVTTDNNLDIVANGLNSFIALPTCTVEGKHIIFNGEKVYEEDPEFIKGKSDAEALLVYYKSIGKNFTIEQFTKLKRFENKSNSYKAGVTSKSIDHLTTYN